MVTGDSSPGDRPRLPATLAPLLLGLFDVQAGEELYLLQVDASRGFVVVAGNDAFLAVHGRTLAEIAGLPFEQLIPAGKRSLAIAKLAEAVSSRREVLYEETTQNERGVVRHTDVRLVPLHEGEGPVTHLLGLVHDRTELKEAEIDSSFLSELDQRVAALDDPVEMKLVTITALGQRLSLAHCIYVRPVGAGVEIRSRFSSPGQKDRSFSLAGLLDPGVLDSLERGEIVVVSDVSSDARTRGVARYYEELGVRSFAFVPTVHKGSWVAAILCLNEEPRAWSPREVELIHQAVVRTRAVIDRCQAFRELEILNERSSSAQEATGVGVWDMDLGSGSIYLSSGFRKIFGLSMTKPISLDQIRSLLHPEDAPRIYALFQDALSALKQEWTSECRFLHPLHGVRWQAGRTHIVYGAQGEVLRASGTVIDVTAQREAERQIIELRERTERSERLYDTILSNIVDFVFVFDLDYRFVYANKAQAELFGLNPDQVEGRGFRELGYPEWHALLHEREIDQVVASRSPVRGTVHFEFVGGSGTYDYIFVPVLGPDGEVWAVAGTARDITDLKRAQDSLRDADRRKNEFLTTLAHELRNPLASLRNGTQLLQLPGASDETRVQALGMMERQLKQMVHLIDDLMDLSRIDRGTIVLRKKELTLSSVLDGTLEATLPLVNAKGHSLRLSLPEAPIWLNGDETRLIQIFSNLVNNAVKYTLPGGKITIEASLESTHVVIRVEDNGIGIEPEQIDHVFGLFTRVSTFPSRSDDGLGIGLHVVKGLVEMHDGSIRVDSPGAGLGSTFTLRFPRVQRDSVPPVSSTSVPSGRSSSTPASRRVLVVDDNEDSADTLALLLEHLGHQVHVAYSGREALELGARIQPEIVIMDIGMPGMDGLTTSRAMRESGWGKATRLIALTGWGKEDDQRRSREAGFDFHLVKPVARAQLVTALDLESPPHTPLVPDRTTPEEPVIG